MGFLIALLIFVVIGVVLNARLFVTADGGLNSRAVVKVAKVFAVLGVITICEFLIPSTILTGRERPTPQTPLRYMDEMPWTDTELSYQSVSRLAPWLWPLGDITRPEMEGRLEADLAMGLSLQAEARAAIPEKYYGWRQKEILRKLDVYVSALEGAADGLDDLFTTATIHGAKANQFVVALMVQAAEELEVAQAAPLAQATAALEAYISANGGVNVDTNEPPYQTLFEAKQDIDFDISGYRSASLDLFHAQRILDSAADSDPDAAQPFPVFTGPLNMFENAQRKIITDPRFQTDPALPTTIPLLARLADAVVGRQRNPDFDISEERCAIGITDDQGEPALRRTCEIAVPLPVNYDISGTFCNTGTLPVVSKVDLTKFGTQVTSDACKETWIHPHLNIVFGRDSIAVHAPRPVGPDGSPLDHSPLSRWFVTWQGVEKPANPAAIFEWDGVTPVVSNLSLRHDAQFKVQFAKRWSDFRALNGDRAITREILSGINATDATGMPTHITGISWDALSPTALAFLAGDTTRPVTQEQLERLEFSLAQRSGAFASSAIKMLALNNWNDLTQGNAVERCDIDSVQIVIGANILRDDLEFDMNAVLGDASCQDAKAYGMILGGLQRDLSDGTWLWLIERDQFVHALR